MSFRLTAIDTVNDPITKEQFQKQYVHPAKPVVLKNFAAKLSAYSKWTPEYLKTAVGNKVLAIYDNKKADPSKPVAKPVGEMPFSTYVDLIVNEPTELRIFLFDIFKHAPDLLNDYTGPKQLIGSFLDTRPTMYFGGGKSVTPLHYDINLAHNFHTQFHGRKRVILFEPKWKERLYCIPFGAYALENYDMLKPDYIRFPALKGVEGFSAELEHGDTLFLPSQYWQWMQYLDGGYSINQSALDQSVWVKAQSLYNRLVAQKLDKALKNTFKQTYLDFKEQIARSRALEAYFRQARTPQQG